MDRKKDPNRKATGGAASEVRRRVIGRLRSLLLTGAAIGGAACDHQVVCDPLPPPPECDKDPSTSDFTRYCIDAVASWQAVEPQPVVAVELRVWVWPEESLRFVADPEVGGAAVRNIVREDRTLTFEVLPETGRTSVDLTVPLDCDGVAEALLLSLDLRDPPSAGRDVPIDSRE